jgi:Protein of unknown function (DUF3892)
MSIRITCIKKAAGNHENTHVAISELGWENESTNATGKSTREKMYDWVNDGNSAYVKDASSGNKADLEAVKTASGTKYVRTKPDGTTKDNLLALPEC